MKKLLSDCKEHIALDILFAFMLFIFAPFEIYLSNKGYFFFQGTEMMGLSTLCFVVCLFLCVIILALARRISGLLYRIVYGMFFGGSIALYLQGNWDTTDYGAWNGAEIDWSIFHKQFITFACLFILLILGCAIVSFWEYNFFNKLANVVSICMCLMLISTLAVLLVSNGGLSKEKEYIATTEGELELSNDKNFIILVLDAYDSEAFSQIINSDSEVYTSMFRDFTYYPDALTGYSSTDMSVPLILTGHDYKNESLFGEYLDKGYANSKLMNWLDANGWEKSIYFDGLMPQGNDGYGIQNSKKLMRVVKNRNELMYYMYTMVLFRYMPQPIKNHFYFYADNIKGNLNMVKGDYEPYTASNFALYDKIEKLSASGETNKFQYIHVEGAHEPFNILKDFSVSNEETSYEEECEGVLVVVDNLLTKMKSEGVYDDSIIMIMADHGFYSDRQNPLLLVKGYNEHHNYEVNNTAVSYFDLQDAYIRLLSGECCGQNVFQGFEEKRDNKRIYRYVPWNTHLNFDTYSGRISEVVFDGPAWDLGSIIDGRIEYAEPEDKLIH